MVLDMRSVGKRGVPHTPHRMTGIPRQAVQVVQQPIEHPFQGTSRLSPRRRRHEVTDMGPFRAQKL